MQIEEAILLGQQALLTVAYVSGPILVVAMAVGVVVALFQAVTQLQEMTIVFVPKIIAVFFMIALLGGWMLEKFVAYGTLCFTSIEDVSD